MAFRFTKTNATKKAFRTQVSRKQNMFKRFKKRFASAKNPTEKRFCRSEANKICKQLKTFAKQYRKFGFGTTSWITKNYNMTSFTKGNARKNTKRTYGRRTNKTYARKTRTWSRGRRNNRSYNKARKSYAAW